MRISDWSSDVCSSDLISAETTFAVDQPLHALDEPLERLAVKVWGQAVKKGAVGRTVVLKLKTDRFRLLTRTLTLTRAPTSAETLAEVARPLCARFALPADTPSRPSGRPGESRVGKGG